MERDLTEQLLCWFPNLNPQEDRITSDASDAYNCVAWATGDTERLSRGRAARPTQETGRRCGNCIAG